MNTSALIVMIIGYAFINILLLFNLTIEDMEGGFNPIQVYKDCNVNWFGCAMLVLSAHTLFLIAAIVYWFYKLCTCGREKGEKHND